MSAFDRWFDASPLSRFNGHWDQNSLIRARRSGRMCHRSAVITGPPLLRVLDAQ